MKIINHALNFVAALLDSIAPEVKRLHPVCHLMPDTHIGMEEPIGFVVDFDAQKGILPSVVSEDIGCGMTVIEIPKSQINWQDFNYADIHSFILNNIPSGSSTHVSAVGNHSGLTELITPLSDKDRSTVERSFGTLGGGNHFIEINEGADTIYVVVHSGSRKLGTLVHKHYAKFTCEKRMDPECLTQREAALKQPEHLRQEALAKIPVNYVPTPYPLTGNHMHNYLNDLKVAQRYASASRSWMVNTLVEYLVYAYGYRNTHYSQWESIHNYLDFTDNRIRKGATPAHKGVKIIVPINMRDGSIIAIGKGNIDWLESAPHGAGRVLSRSAAKEKISLAEYQKAMEGVNTFSVTEFTRDEAPMAYRGMDEIVEATKDTMEIVEIAKPLFNFKG